jgi:16S rRNA (guanine1207-N2)-methyltransferase
MDEGATHLLSALHIVLKRAQMTDYYTYRRLAARLRDRDIAVVGKPGVWSWNEINPGTRALLEAPRFALNEAVLDLGCGTGAIGAYAAKLSPRGSVTLVDCNIAATACAARTLETNAISNAEVRLGDGASGLAPASYDLVLSHLPRGKDVQQELIRGAAWVLRTSGRFYLVAHKRAGVKGAVAYASEIFGRCGVVRQKKGYHVAMMIKPHNLAPSPPLESYVARTITLYGIDTTLVSKPGLFAWDRLDDGTAALIDVMEIEPSDRVLDLGCGTGLAGLVAARLASEGQVVLADADLRAVEAARRTITANGIGNAKVTLSDCASALLDSEPFDVVITNPPFHQGLGVNYEVARQFVRDAARVLRPGGRLFLVANRFLRYDDLIREAFGDLAIAHADQRYRVLKAVARKSGLV